MKATMPRKPSKGARSFHVPAFSHFGKLSPVEKLAVWMTAHVGSMEFFFIVLGWTILWLLWNIFGPAEYRFDPFPAFVLWLFISNMLQLFLTPLIMISQSLQNKGDEARAEAEFKVNLRAERDTEEILKRLDEQNALLMEIRERLKKNG